MGLKYLEKQFVSLSQKVGWASKDSNSGIELPCYNIYGLCAKRRISFG